MPSRLQLALDVNDLGEAVAFYWNYRRRGGQVAGGLRELRDRRAPLKLVLLENPGQGGSLNHLGVEVPDTDAVAAEQARLAGTGLAPAEAGETTCCFAKQDEFWVQGAPDGESWEIYAVLADSQTFYAEGHGPECCGDTNVHTEDAAGSAAKCC